MDPRSPSSSPTGRTGSGTALVVPCFDEVRRLDPRRLIPALDRLDDVRLVLVDDGSRDGTRTLLRAIRAARPERVEVVELACNRGKAEAVRAGALHALQSRPGYLGYWDADLATPLEVVTDFRALLERRRDLEMVLGARVRLLGRTIRRRAARHCAGRAFATLASWTLALPIYDSQCGAKLLRVEPHTAELFREPFVSRWAFDVELLARRKALGRALGLASLERSLYEFTLESWSDVPGSKVSLAGMARAVLDLARIRARHSRPPLSRTRSPAPEAARSRS